MSAGTPAPRSRIDESRARSGRIAPLRERFPAIARGDEDASRGHRLVGTIDPSIVKSLVFLVAIAIAVACAAERFLTAR